MHTHPWLPKFILLLVPGTTLGCDLDSAPIDDLETEVAPTREPTPVEPTADAQLVGYDEERQLDLYDSDHDTFPDLTEQLFGTNMLDPDSTPGQAGPSFPIASCRVGYQQAGARLCISSTTKNATNYMNADSSCRNGLGRICSYYDLAYLYLNTALDASYNAGAGVWIGDTVGDDAVLCGNRSITSNNDPDISNFDGVCNRSGSHPYWCCHDDES